MACALASIGQLEILASFSAAVRGAESARKATDQFPLRGA
jgi:hypothetical protein